MTEIPKMFMAEIRRKRFSPEEIFEPEAMECLSQRGDGGEGTDRFAFSDRADLTALGLLAERLGSKLSWDYIQAEGLFGFDASAPALVVCDSCESKFRPRKWAIISKEPKQYTNADGTVAASYAPGDVILDRETGGKLYAGNYLPIKTASGAFEVHPFCNACMDGDIGIGRGILGARWIGFDRNGNQFKRDKPLPTMTKEAAIRRSQATNLARDRVTRERAAREANLARAFGVRPGTAPDRGNRNGNRR